MLAYQCGCARRCNIDFFFYFFFCLSRSSRNLMLWEYVFRSLPILACVTGASAFLTGPAAVPGTARYQQAVNFRSGLSLRTPTLASLRMQYNAKDPQWLNRDRFVLSGGHGSMFLYALASHVWLCSPHVRGQELSPAPLDDPWPP